MELNLNVLKLNKYKVILIIIWFEYISFIFKNLNYVIDFEKIY